MADRFAYSAPYNLLDPPPPCFHRPPARSMPYTRFQEIVVLAVGCQLNQGFAPALPPSATQPHPFATHDITEEDWLRFLGDVQRAGTLSALDVQRPNDLRYRGVGPITGLIANIYAEDHMKHVTAEPVFELFQQWNQYFWHPRGIDVTLVVVDDTSASSPLQGHVGGRNVLLSTPLGVAGYVREQRHQRIAERRVFRNELRGGLLRTAVNAAVGPSHDTVVDPNLHRCMISIKSL